MSFSFSLGLLCDLLWSDPDKDITGWSENDRGVSFTFGPDVVSRFLQKHDMDLICRAHQVSYLKFFCPVMDKIGLHLSLVICVDSDGVITDLSLLHPFLEWLGCGGWVRVLCEEALGHAIFSTKLLWRV